MHSAKHTRCLSGIATGIGPSENPSRHDGALLHRSSAWQKTTVGGFSPATIFMLLERSGNGRSMALALGNAIHVDRNDTGETSSSERVHPIRLRGRDRLRELVTIVIWTWLAPPGMSAP